MNLWPPELAGAEPIVLPARTVLAREGQRASTIYLIESGVVTLTRNRNGRDVLVGCRSRGYPIGAACAVHGSAHRMTVSAIGEIRAVPIPGNTIHDLRLRSLAVAAWLHTIFAAEIASHVEWHANYSDLAGEDRLVELFVELFRLASDLRSDGSRRLLVTERVEDLANGVGISREHTSRLLSVLMAKGVVGRDTKGWFVAPAGSSIHRSLIP